jgi:hypothetical protein
MLIDERTGPFQVAFPTANSTAASIVEPVPTLTRPSGDGVIDTRSEIGGANPTRILVLPFGAGAATNTCLLNLYGWKILPPHGTNQVAIWVPFFLSSYTVTLCTVPGLANTDLNASQFMAGTIVVVKGGTAGVDYGIMSPTGNSVASVWQKLNGASIVSVVTGLNSSATSVNALVALM